MALSLKVYSPSDRRAVSYVPSGEMVVYWVVPCSTEVNDAGAFPFPTSTVYLAKFGPGVLPFSVITPVISANDLGYVIKGESGFVPAAASAAAAFTRPYPPLA